MANFILISVHPCQRWVAWVWLIAHAFQRHPRTKNEGQHLKNVDQQQKHSQHLRNMKVLWYQYPILSNIQISEWCLCGSCPSRHISISLAPGTRCQLVELAMEPAVLVKAPHLPLPQLAAAPLQLPMQAVPGGIWTMSSDFRWFFRLTNVDHLYIYIYIRSLMALWPYVISCKFSHTHIYIIIYTYNYI
jgi:hypothetical protein